jgi:hypothetical protein
MIMTVGRIQFKNGSVKRFVQTVFLAEQPSGYYVLNDMFRFINAESEDPVPVVERSSLSSLQAEEPAPTAADVAVAVPVVEKKKEEPQAQTVKEEKKEEPIIKTLQNKPGPIAPPSSASRSNSAKEPSSPSHSSSPSSPASSSWASLAAIQDSNQWKSSGIIAAAETAKIVITEVAVEAPVAAPLRKVFTPRNNNAQQPKGEWKPHFNPAASIYVGGLRMDPKPTEQDIRQIFSPYGQIKTVDWGKDCAYVEFESAEASQKIHNQVVTVAGADVKILPRRVMHPGYRFHNNNNNSNNAYTSSNNSTTRAPRVFSKKTPSPTFEDANKQ